MKGSPVIFWATWKLLQWHKCRHKKSKFSHRQNEKKKKKKAQRPVHPDKKKSIFVFIPFSLPGNEGSSSHRCHITPCPGWQIGLHATLDKAHLSLLKDCKCLFFFMTLVSSLSPMGGWLDEVIQLESTPTTINIIHTSRPTSSLSCLPDHQTRAPDLQEEIKLYFRGVYQGNLKVMCDYACESFRSLQSSLNHLEWEAVKWRQDQFHRVVQQKACQVSWVENKFSRFSQ